MIKTLKIHALMVFIFSIAPFGGLSQTMEKKQYQKETKKFENCQYFLTTGLENDNLFSFGNGNNVDDGYTHGHLTRITKSCDSGVDININVDSRLFTELFFRRSRTNKIVALNLFEEEIKISVEYTDWRNFNKMYQSAELTVGTLSRDRLLIAGLEHKLFHEFMGSPVYQRPKRPPENEKISEEYIVARGIFDDIPEYGYLPQNNANREFFGGKFAFGKSYSLDGLKSICDNQCIDYVRTEAGVEVLSLKHGSNIYLFSEINKSLPHPLEALSVFASIKAQKNDGRGRPYGERSLGLKFSFSEFFQLHYILTKRKLPEKGSRFIEYDSDEDNVIFVGFQVPL